MREYFDPDWTEYLFGLLFTATWQAAVLIAAAFLGSLCTRRAVVRCRIWTACVFGLPAAPLLSILLPHACVGFSSAAEPLHFPTFVPRPRTVEIGLTSVWTFSEGYWGDWVCRALVYLWLAMVAAALLRIARAWINAVRLLGMARPCDDPRAQAIASKVARRPNAVTLLQLDGVRGAVCWQIHRPKIILPSDALRLPDAELEMMIQHEWSHIRRSDPALLFVQRLVEVFYWFHPLVWCVALQTSRYREFVCDDQVIAAGFDRNAYAKCMGKLAVWYYGSLPMVPAGLGMVWGQHLVLQRVKRLLQADGSSEKHSTIRRLAMSGMALLLILCIALVRVEGLSTGRISSVRWTAWPTWTARALDTLGVQVRDYPLDAHRYDPHEVSREVDSVCRGNLDRCIDRSRVHTTRAGQAGGK